MLKINPDNEIAKDGLAKLQAARPRQKPPEMQAQPKPESRLPPQPKPSGKLLKAQPPQEELKPGTPPSLAAKPAPTLRKPTSKADNTSEAVSTITQQDLVFLITRLVLGILGAIILFISPFLPALRVPIVGSTSQLQLNEVSGIAIMLLALMSLVFVLLKWDKGSLFTSLTALGLTTVVVLRIYQGLSEFRKLMAEGDDLFGLGELLAQSVQIEWGWAVTALGALLVLAAAGIGLTTEVRSALAGGKPDLLGKPFLGIGAAVGGALTLIIVFAGYTFLIEDEIRQALVPPTATSTPTLTPTPTPTLIPTSTPIPIPASARVVSEAEYYDELSSINDVYQQSLSEMVDLMDMPESRRDLIWKNSFQQEIDSLRDSNRRTRNIKAPADWQAFHAERIVAAYQFDKVADLLSIYLQEPDDHLLELATEEMELGFDAIERSTNKIP